MKHLKLFLTACFLLLLSGFTQAQLQLVGKHISECPNFYEYVYKDTLSGNIKRYESWETTNLYFIGVRTLCVQDSIILLFALGMEAKHAIPQCTELIQNAYNRIRESLIEGCISHKTDENKEIYYMPDYIEVVLLYDYKNGKNMFSVCSTLK